MKNVCHLSFKKLFLDVTEKYIGNKVTAEKIYEDIIKKYSARGRHYHNIGHIYKMCQLWLDNKKSFERPDSVFLAIVFHDIIYKSRKSDNEQKSALYFKEIALKYFDRMKEPFINRIMDLINLTKHDVRSTREAIKHRDSKLLLDFDLSVLSSSEEEYEEYYNNIRKEYRIYPNFMYRPGRIKVLQSFLDKDKIYLSKEFSSREKNAIKNIKNEINLLTLKKI